MDWRSERSENKEERRRDPSERSTAQPAPAPNQAERISPVRLLPLALVVATSIAFVTLSALYDVDLGVLHEYRLDLVDWVARNLVPAIVCYVAVYALAVVLVPPSATLMTVAGGFLFGVVLGTALTVVAATIGATLLFLVARHSLGGPLARRAGPHLRRLEAGFRANALSYMLFLRLVPLFPFWLVNVAPAFLGVRLRDYVIGTLFGIVPGTAVYAVFGAGLGSVIDRNETISLDGILTPEIAGAMVGLGVLSLLPVAVKRLRRQAGEEDRG
jgi:uncharacterized membrane protein YdjX (TVP38/TMEM64 family)